MELCKHYNERLLQVLKGAKVRIRTDLVPNKLYSGYTLTSSMEQYRGCIATVTRTGLTSFDIDLDNGAFGWTLEMVTIIRGA